MLRRDPEESPDPSDGGSSEEILTDASRAGTGAASRLRPMPDASPPTLPSWTVPTRLGAAWFRFRAFAHVLRRAVADRVTSPVTRHRTASALQSMSVIAEHRSPLWADGRAEEFALVAGKVENLRVARRAFDGIEVDANAVFSFWKQLGRPTRGRGFVAGREIRAGCVVPVVAGGLCQLSNAIVRCAVDAGMTLVERHGHSARVEQSHDGAQIDATVFWNYVDLRLAAPFDWRLEVTLTADELVVRVRAAREPAQASRTIAIAGARTPLPAARGCLTCDETRCFRHPGLAHAPAAGATAVLVDAWTPEFARHLATHVSQADWFLPWVRAARRIDGAWTPPPGGTHTIAHRASWRRTWWLRRAAGEGGGRQAAVMRGQQALAQSFARRLAPHHTHLVVDQGLLLPLARLGALQGRTVDVLMPALPIAELQRRLDDAASRTPAAESLRDFRAPSTDADIEAAALRAATGFATPHRAVAEHLRAHFPGRVDELPWTPAPATAARPTERARQETPLVAFPASALARKGAPELAAALRHLGWRVLVLGAPSDDAALWHGIDVEHARLRDDEWLQRADVVALPAWIEHAPRALLRALAHGLPVVASRACGLPSAQHLHEIDAGDVVALVHALRRAMRTEETLTPA